MWFASVWDIPLHRSFPPSLPSPENTHSHEIVLVEPVLVTPAPFPPRAHQLLVILLPLLLLLLPLLQDDECTSQLSALLLSFSIYLLVFFFL